MPLSRYGLFEQPRSVFRDLRVVVIGNDGKLLVHRWLDEWADFLAGEAQALAPVNSSGKNSEHGMPTSRSIAGAKSGDTLRVPFSMLRSVDSAIFNFLASSAGRML